MPWPRCASADTKHRASQGKQHPDLCVTVRQAQNAILNSRNQYCSTAPTPRLMNIYRSQLMRLILAHFTFLNKKKPDCSGVFGNLDTALFKTVIENLCTCSHTLCLYVCVHQHRENHKELFRLQSVMGITCCGQISN